MGPPDWGGSPRDPSGGAAFRGTAQLGCGEPAPDLLRNPAGSYDDGPTSRAGGTLWLRALRGDGEHSAVTDFISRSTVSTPSRTFVCSSRCPGSPPSSARTGQARRPSSTFSPHFFRRTPVASFSAIAR